MNEKWQLLAKRQCQEEEESHHKDLLAKVEDLQADKEIVDELMSRIDKLVDLKWFHEDCIQRYKTQLSSLKDKINQIVLSQEELNTQFSNEHEEAHQMFKVLQQENKEAYRMCKVFQ